MSKWRVLKEPGDQQFSQHTFWDDGYEFCDLCNCYLTDDLTPLPISHLWENYLPSPNSHLCEIHMCTCINCNEGISLHAYLKIVNQNRQWHGRNVLLHIYFVRCALAHSYNLYCAQGLPQGSSLENKSVSGGSFIRGKSVKEELSMKPFLRPLNDIISLYRYLFSMSKFIKVCFVVVGNLFVFACCLRSLSPFLVYADWVSDVCIEGVFFWQVGQMCLNLQSWFWHNCVGELNAKQYSRVKNFHDHSLAKMIWWLI